MLTYARFPGGWLGDENNAFTKEVVLHIKMNILTLLLNCSMEKTNEAVHFENDALHS
jgi:hypothetical protein